MNVAIVIPTHNRIDYTQKVIPRLLEDPDERFDLYLWDNASTDETPEYLRSLKDSRIRDVHLSKTNEGQTGAMNWAWSQTDAEYVGKLDNDCLPAQDWTRLFSEAHQDIPMLGSLAMWHFPLKEFDGALAAAKIQTFGKHRIFRHAWTCGSGFIMKRATYVQIGPWDTGKHVGTTGYFLKMARAGYVNGWYYPLVLQEHMDDPESQHSFFHKLEFDKAYADSYGYNYAGIKDMENYVETRARIINDLLTSPFAAGYYAPWRRSLRRIVNRIFMPKGNKSVGQRHS